MVTRRDSIWKSLDWVTIAVYLILIVFGWFSVCGASYDYGDRDFLDFSTRTGKQFVWIICSFGLGFVLLMLDDSLYDMFSYLIYIGLMSLLLVTIFIAPDTKGSRSWLILGPVSLQPAEFAKFATALALAKYMSAYSYTMKNWKNACMQAFLILLPMSLIIMQRETGSALVYSAFFLMLYREGMPGGVLFVGFCAIVYFVVGIRFDAVMMGETHTPVGEFAVLLMVLLSAVAMVWVYEKRGKLVRNMLAGSLGMLLVAYLFSEYVMHFNLVWVQWALCALLIGYLIFLSLEQRRLSYFLIGLFALGSIGFLYSCDYFFNRVLEPHQQMRIKVVLGMEEDLTGAGYNVNQSKIAIGSGGLTGKGFLNGTQTKLKYVPEQDTDFIFCTVGEEEGFVGSAVVLLLFLILILRLITLSERQPTVFGRVYGYSVLSIFLFHLFINIGMVLGLTPVIGIPLPFFSYGGSSLWGFTILLFIFLRIDAGRNRRL
ncbi:rod shape determining protein RodA [Bacteroides zoogleoformans]|uniref:Cell wall polymerase n=1 Tax=Bacteroides zoogleoformans TaxID=28119 RepID=A0ABM6T7Y1_9BACE|nr:rod shape-determining protein RodA [Bacteroides zoogleoformans]AVM52717.1 rod shape-determining protein RodA [Bacteroides zoogleoformans]TWJ11173.1 rod shape determining protein RodA [Bacteroides zoogleoformans]